MPKNALKAGLSALALAASVEGAQAQGAPGAWDFGLNIYLWGAGLDATTGTGSTVSLSFGDILENLNFALMGTFIARRDTLVLFGDAIYLSLGNSTSGTANPGPGPGVPVSADVNVKGFITTLGAGYNVQYDDAATLSVFGGARGLFLDTDLDLTVNGRPGNVSSSDSYWDFIVGARGRSRLADRWALTYYADIGAGQSDLTYQAVLTANYLFDTWELSFGYRHMHWDLGDEEILSETSFSGPIVGATFRF